MKNIKFSSVILVIILLLCSFVGCEESNSGYPVKIGETEISQQPQTVVVISEQAASAICALGYKSYLVGAPSEFFKTEMEGITDIGGSMDIDFDKIYELAPNLLIVQSEVSDSARENLKARGIEVLVLKTPTKYDEVAPYFESLSKIFLGNEKYTEAYDPYIGESERIIEETAKSLKGNTKKVALFVEEGFIATGDTIAGGAMAKAGFTNIGEKFTDYLMGIQDIRKADPEIIFCPAGVADTIMENESYKDITAVKIGAVYEVDVEALVYAGEGFAATLQSMSKYLLQ